VCQISHYLFVDSHQVWIFLLVFQGTPFLVHATREIVLSAGAIGTPQILLLSGIGPTADLTALGISTIIDNPSVGNNLSDHALLTNNFAVSGSDTLDDIVRGTTFAAALAQWVADKTGAITNTVANHLGFLRLPSTASIFTTVPDPATGPTASHWELVVSVSTYPICMAINVFLLLSSES
jgi:choline dehydrogenase-like flavoprotein